MSCSRPVCIELAVFSCSYLVDSPFGGIRRHVKLPGPEVYLNYICTRTNTEVQA